MAKIKSRHELMSETVPDSLKEELNRANALHQRATSDYEKCVEFNKVMAKLLADLEDAGCYRSADKVMSLLLDCNPKEGSSCEKSTLVGERTQKIISWLG